MKSKTITLPVSVYSEEMLRRAISDYRAICRISFTPVAGVYACTISHSVADVDLTAHEFMNYLVEVACSGRSE